MAGTNSSSTTALLSDNRVKVILAITVIAVIWAAVAHTIAGSRKDSMEALETRLAETERQHQQIQAQMTDVEAAELDLATLQQRMGNLEVEQAEAEAALASTRADIANAEDDLTALRGERETREKETGTLN